MHFATFLMTTALGTWRTSRRRPALCWGDQCGLRDTWSQYRSYFDGKENSNEWFEAQRRPLLTDIPMLVRFLEQNRTGLYRRTVWRVRWRHLSKHLGTRSGRRPMLIPWWAWVLI